MSKARLKSQTDSRKRLISFCLGLSTKLLSDILSQAGLDDKRDIATLQLRVRREGLGFLTKTLPNMGKAINFALLGNRLSIPQFKTCSGTALPHFLKGLLSRIFDRDGYVRDDAEICAITDITQLCFMFYKLEVPYDPKIEGKILDKFTRVDQDLPDDFTHLGDPDLRLEPNILREARNLITRLLSRFNPKDITPRHGPGAVATGERPQDKMRFRRIYSHAEEAYPASEFYFLNSRHLFDEWENQYDSLEYVDNPCAKVMLVPKDSRGPRLISAEPLEIQFLQQGLGKKLVAWIERHPMTRGHVNFSDQLVNRNLALAGSKDGSWATLDLEDASDRVSLALVRELFRDTGILPYLEATRSTCTRLPNGETVHMRKFAPMGSALCFPVEALCFWALAAACIHVIDGASLKLAMRSTYVYGDDIIVKSGFEEAILSNFHYFALRLNKKKCCYTGFFRESCGCDAFRGQVVTPIKVKRLPFFASSVKKKKRKKSSTPPIDGASLASWVSISNLLFQKGYYLAADYVKKHVEGQAGIIPLSMRDPQRVNVNSWDSQDRTFRHKDESEAVSISDTAPVWYVRQVPSLEVQMNLQDVPAHRIRYNGALQRYEFRTLTVQSITFKKRKDYSGWSELFRHMLAGLGTTPYQYALLRRVKLQRRWISLSY